jgi:hypothetical protein
MKAQKSRTADFQLEGICFLDDWGVQYINWTCQ